MRKKERIELNKPIHIKLKQICQSFDFVDTFSMKGLYIFRGCFSQECFYIIKARKQSTLYIGDNYMYIITEKT